MIHSIEPGYYCGPTVVQAITGQDMHSVILPAFNRAMGAPWLMEEVIEVKGHFIVMVLSELGYRTLRWKKTAYGDVGSWHDRYPEEVVMLFTKEHVLVMHNAIAFDNHTPMGKLAISHPFSNIKVTDAFIVRPK